MSGIRRQDHYARIEERDRDREKEEEREKVEGGREGGEKESC